MGKCVSHVNCFVCFFIYYMCDGSIASIASPIISLVTGKNEYEINALMNIYISLNNI